MMQRRWIIDPNIHTTESKKVCPIWSETNEKFVVKLEGWKSKSRDDFYRELHFQKLFAERGITPPVEFYWETSTCGGFVMPYLDRPLDEIFFDITSKDERRKLIKDAVSLIDVMHEMGYSHNDCNGSNFMVSLQKHRVPRVWIIDFETTEELIKGDLFDYDFFYEEHSALGDYVLQPVLDRLRK